MANIHILSGISADRSIVDFIENGYELKDLIISGPGAFPTYSAVLVLGVFLNGLRMIFNVGSSP